MNTDGISERGLVLLLCGTEERRRAREDEAVALLQQLDGDRLLRLLERLNLVTLVGQRVLALPARVAPRVARQIEFVTRAAREHGTMLEVITLAVLANLEDASIRALPLKGSILARALYGDTAMRSSVDVDLLVAPEDLRHATDVVQRMGWAREHHHRGGVGGLPDLHERLVHPKLPSVEVHWRVHWYERSFAVGALDRAWRPGPAEPLRMQPADELASLILFYARDGFAGLRTPADIASWSEAMGPELRGGPGLDAIGGRHPDLAGPLRVGSSLLSQLVGVPAQWLETLRPRWRLAAEIANPFLVGARSQLSANAGLVDLVLCPPQCRRTSLRRHLLDVRPCPERRSEGRGPLRRRVSNAQYALRVVRRWVLALIPVGGYARSSR